MSETRSFRLSRPATVVLAEASHQASQYGISIQGGAVTGTIAGKAQGAYRVEGQMVNVTLDANNTGFPNFMLWSALKGFLER